MYILVYICNRYACIYTLYIHYIHIYILSIYVYVSIMYWRRKWRPTPVFLPGESQGWGSLVDCHLWGLTESDTTNAI